MTGITRILFGATFVTVLAISVHDRAGLQAAPSAAMAEATQPQSLQSAGVHRLVGSSLRGIHAGF